MYIPSKIDFVSVEAAVATAAVLNEKIWSGMPVRPNVTMAAAAILFVARFIILGLKLNDDVKRVLATTRRHNKKLPLPKNFIAITILFENSFHFYTIITHEKGRGGVEGCCLRKSKKAYCGSVDEKERTLSSFFVPQLSADPGPGF